MVKKTPKAGLRANLPGIILALCLFALYVINASRTVTFGDSGELASAVHVLGVAHSSGYPLYIILGKMFSLLPIGSLAFRLSVMSSLFAALAAYLMYLILKEVTKDEGVSLFSSGLFGLSSLLWSQAVIVEVYTLSVSLMACLLYLGVLYMRKERREYLYLMALVFGLGLSNHLTIVTLVPGIAAIVLLGTKRPSRKDIAIMALLVIIGLLPYLLLPLRSSSNLVLNYGDLSRPGNFIRHVAAWEFQQRTGRIGLGDLLLPVGLALLIMRELFIFSGLSVIGIYDLYSRNRRLLIALILIVATNLVLAIKNVAIATDVHFFPSLIAFIVFTGSGALAIIRISGRKGLAIPIAAGLMVIAAGYTLYTSGDAVARSHDYKAQEYFEYIEDEVDHGSILIGRNDDDLFPLMYFQITQGRLNGTALMFYRNIAMDGGRPLSSLSRKEAEDLNYRVYDFILRNIDRYDIYTTMNEHRDVTGYNTSAFPLKRFDKEEVFYILNTTSS